MAEALLIIGGLVVAGLAVAGLLTYRGGPHGADDMPPEDML